MQTPVWRVLLEVAQRLEVVEKFISRLFKRSWEQKPYWLFRRIA